MENSNQNRLLERAKAGDSQSFEALFAPVRLYARALSRRFFVQGWDTEDLYQEALAGFAAALLGFEGGRGVNFDDFARLTMRNAVVGCVRRATRVKRQSQICPAGLEDLELLSSDQFRPDVVVEQQAECAELLSLLRETLSLAEWTVLSAVLEGSSLSEVAAREGLNQRAVENALSRARVKARRLVAA